MTHTHLEPVKYTLPAYWASYLINGDASGIEPADKAQADKFLADHSLPSPVDCGESYFAHSNDAGTLAGDVMEYTFLVSEQGLDAFTEAYILAALWTFDDDAPSGDYAASGRYDALFPKIAPETLERMKADCAKFQAANSKDLCIGVSRNAEMGGHDFWLTRNGHGSGFWDGDYWAEDTGVRLTKAANAFGECSLYYGDDGMIYL